MNKRLGAILTAVMVIQSLMVPTFASEQAKVQEISEEVLEQESKQIESIDRADTTTTTQAAIEINKSSYSYDLENGEARNVKYLGEISNDGKVVFPDTIDGYPVTSIGSFALLSINTKSEYTQDYYARTDLVREVVLPETVKTINDQAFFNCNKLEKINVPTSLEKIGNEAFIFDYRIKHLDFSNTNLKYIGKYAFWAVSDLETLILPNSLETLGDFALGFTDSLNDVDLSQTKLKIIPQGAFNESGVQSIELPESITTLGRGSFYGLKRLKVLDLSMTKIKDTNKNMLDSCQSIEKVIFPDTLQTINVRAFTNCRNLVETNIEQLPNLKVISNYAFQNDIKVQLAALPEGVTTVGNSAFNMCDSIEELTIPESFVKGTDAKCFPKSAVLNVITGTYGEEYAKRNKYQYIDERLYSFEIVSGEAKHVKYIGEIPTDGKVIFPAKLKGCPVTSIGSFALLNIKGSSEYTRDFIHVQI